MNTASLQGEPDYRWQVVAPPTGIPDSLPVSQSTSGFLTELSEFRGRMLYADGRRPRFARVGGQYVDDDLLDRESFHVTVRTDGALIGCVRVTPLPEYSRSFIGRRVGPSYLEAAVNMMNLARTECAEAGRWIVAPSARGTVLSRLLLLSLWVMGQWLDKRCLFGAVGVRDGQSTMVGRCGGHVAPGIAPVFVRDYDDELSVMYFDLNHPPPRIATQLKRVRRILNVSGDFYGPALGRTHDATPRVTRIAGLQSDRPSPHGEWAPSTPTMRHT
jgi:hypothetical protein